MKPQFEAGAREASKGKGVIRDEAVRQRAFAEVRAQLAAAGFVVAGECDSRLRGPKGNLERFVLCTRGGALGDS
jgi:23S rRNA (cytidine1920-2'-O)/16S rRNA (cytidine1409-2'-O)-methyltransferase